MEKWWSIGCLMFCGEFDVIVCGSVEVDMYDENGWLWTEQSGLYISLAKRTKGYDVYLCARCECEYVVDSQTTY